MSKPYIDPDVAKLMGVEVFSNQKPYNPSDSLQLQKITKKYDIDYKNRFMGKYNKIKHNGVVYILRLEQNKYYIGFTNCFEGRIFQHMLGFGVDWTRKYKIIDVIEVYTNVSMKEESFHTRRYMNLYGKRNVRGSAWCNVEDGAYDNINIPNVV
jgi:predicted GIY-YIG superfamily endonuclease